MTAGRTQNTLSQEWGTPEKYVQPVLEFFGGQLELDPCSNQYSIVPAKTKYQLPEHDGLKVSWNYATIYVNPPYGIDKLRGTSIKLWLGRCALAHQEHKSEVLALVPVATNTGHWKKFVFGQAAGLCFLSDTRLKFLVNGQDGGKGAPMSCAMIYWGKDFNRFLSIFAAFGAVIDLRYMKNQPVIRPSATLQLELIHSAK